MTTVSTLIEKGIQNNVGPEKPYKDRAMLDAVIEQMGIALTPYVEYTKHRLRAPTLTLTQAEKGNPGYNPTEALAIATALGFRGKAMDDFIKAAEEDYKHQRRWLSGDMLRPLLTNRSMQQDILQAAFAAVQLAQQDSSLQEEFGQIGNNKPSRTLDRPARMPVKPREKEAAKTTPKAMGSAQHKGKKPNYLRHTQPSAIGSRASTSHEADLAWPYGDELPRSLGLRLLEDTYEKVINSGGINGPADIAIRQIEMNYRKPPFPEAMNCLRDGNYTEFNQILDSIRSGEKQKNLGWSR